MISFICATDFAASSLLTVILTISDPALEGVILNAVPLQIVCVLFAITGLAFTLTTIVKLFQSQGPTGEVGVMV
jgi:hypothetical protein